VLLLSVAMLARLSYLVASPASLSVCFQQSTTQSPPAASTIESGVTIESSYIVPGQSVVFHLPAGAKKVVAYGGRFGKGLDVTKETNLTDEPVKTTTYGFDIFDQAVPAKGSKKRAPSPKASKHFQVTAEVYSGKFPPLSTYNDTRGWHIDTIAGWNAYPSQLPDPANNALIYLEQQEDGPERMAVAILPVTMTNTELMKKVMTETPSQYDVLKVIDQKETTQCGVPATWLNFQGIDPSLKDIPTRSMVMTFVKDGKGYVISGRTRASQFKERERLIRCLMRSFSFTPIPPKPADIEKAKKEKEEAAKKKPAPEGTGGKH
jgi:hypothetical protein